MKLVACILLGLLAGCVAGSTHTASRHAGLTTARSGWQHGDDLNAVSMRAIAERLRAASVQPTGTAFEGFLTTGARATHRVELPSSSCMTLLAIASTGVQDMDAALYSREGELLATDAQPDPYPAIHVCSGTQALTLYYALQVYEGTGSYLVVAFKGSKFAMDDLTRVLGKQPIDAQLGEPATDGPGRFEAFRDGMQHRGFIASQAPVRVPMVAGQKLRLSLPIESGVCYTVAVFALAGTQNLDLLVLDDTGNPVARDSSLEQDASAQFCSSHAAEFSAEVHDVEGAGEATILFLRVEAAAIGGANGLWLGERPLAAASTLPLAEAVAEVSRRAQADGFGTTRTLLTGRLAPGEAIARDFVLGAKRCARIDAVGGPGMRAFALRVRDERGTAIENADAKADAGSVQLCTETEKKWTLEVLAVAGSGPFALTMHESPLPTAAQPRPVAAH